MINVGTEGIKAISFGNASASKAYMGDTLVWSSEDVYTALTCEYRILSAGTYDICSIEAASEQTYIVVDGVEYLSTTAFTFNAPGTYVIEFPGIQYTLGATWFAAIHNLVTVHFPITMNWMGSGVFTYCSDLEYADMSKTNIWSVNGDSFYQCSKLKEIKLAAGQQYVYANTFNGCRSVSSVTFGVGIQKIYNSAFKEVGKDVPGGINIVIPSAVTEIDHLAFYDARIVYLSLPEGLQTIGNYAFWNSNLTDLFLPSTVTSIGDGAFYRAISGYIFLNEGLETIGDSAFFGCGASDLVIPSTVTSIGDRAFEDVGYETVKFMGATPPVMGDTIFGYVADYRPQVFYVPAASLQAYTTALTASYSGYTSHIVAY